MAKVRITKRAAIARASAGIQLTAATNGTNGNHQFNSNNIPGTLRFSEPPIKVGGTLQPVDRADANLEAENGETAVLSLGGLPAQFKIGGKRHSQGGTPLNLPDDSFIFSDTAKMKITDLSIQAQFGMVPKKSGYTPAAIAKKYDINKFRKVLADPNSEDIDRKTAEASIANCNIKLGKLALVQESMKGFPQGIPAIAMPYILANNIDPKSYLPTEGQAEQPDADMGVARYGGNMVSQFNTVDSTPLLKAQLGRTLSNKINELNNQKFLEEQNLFEPNKDAQERLESNTLYDLYSKAQKSIISGDVGSAENYTNEFNRLAQQFGYDPAKADSLMSYNQPLTKDPFEYKQEIALGKNKQIKSNVESKIKNWLKPTAEELKSLSKDETAYLERLYKKFNYPNPISKLTNTTSPELPLQKVASNQNTVLEVPNIKIISKKPTSKPASKTSASTTIGTYTYAPSKKYGGSSLPKAQDGKIIKDYGYDPKSKKIYPIYDDNTQGEADVLKTELSEEDYNYLNALKTAAEEANAKNPNKFNQETQDFQIAYHKLLPENARDINIHEGENILKPTQKGIDLGLKTWDINQNTEGLYGSRTKRYMDDLTKVKPKATATAKTPEKKAEEATKDAFGRNPPKGFTYNNANAPWWLQDIISTAGAVGDKASIVNQRPWQATPDFSLIENVKYDPTRELAANAEQANIANQAAMYFTDPRQLAAQQAATQGLAGKNAADIMGRYNSLNVGLANQTNAQNTAIKNQASATKAGLATSLYDKNIAANDNFNIARKQATQNIRNSYINAITNRANTANLNTMNPNYAVNPTTGGMTYFRPSGEFLATNAAGNKYAEAVRLAKEMAPGDPALQAQVLKDILSNGQDQNNTGYPSRYAIPGYQGQNG